MKKQFLLVLICVFVSANVRAELCPSWNRPEQIGSFGRELSEVSGIVASQTYPDRIYSHNDSGSRSEFFQSSYNGSSLKKISIQGVSPSDVEDIALGRCVTDGSSSCIYLGDIGDNSEKKSSLKIYVVKEQEDFPSSVVPEMVITLTYPDKAHNAEALAMHPSGDLFIITKETQTASSVFKFSREDLERKNAKGSLIGKIDIKGILKAEARSARITGMDISQDGTKFLVLTYLNAVEFLFDLGKVNTIPENLVNGTDYSVAGLKVLQQQESIAYLKGTNSFLYSSEAGFLGSSSPIMKVNCSQN